MAGSNGGDVRARLCPHLIPRIPRKLYRRLITRDGKGFNEKFTRKVVV